MVADTRANWFFKHLLVLRDSWACTRPSFRQCSALPYMHIVHLVHAQTSAISRQAASLHCLLQCTGTGNSCWVIGQLLISFFWNLKKADWTELTELRWTDFHLTFQAIKILLITDHHSLQRWKDHVVIRMSIMPYAQTVIIHIVLNQFITDVLLVSEVFCFVPLVNLCFNAFSDAHPHLHSLTG